MKTRIILAGMILLVLGVGGWFLAAYLLEPAPPQAVESLARKPANPEDIIAERDMLTKALSTAPEYQPFFARYEMLYAEEFVQFTHEEAAKLAQTNAGAVTPDAIVLDGVDNLRRSRGMLAAKASPDMMSRIFDIQAKVLAALAIQDPRLCDHFLFGGEAPAFADFSKGNRSLIAEMATAGLEAMADGEARNIKRDPPSDEDFALLEKYLNDAGLIKTEVSALLDGQMPTTPIDNDRLCKIGRIYYDSLKALPPQAKFSIYALALESMAQ